MALLKNQKKLQEMKLKEQLSTGKSICQIGGKDYGKEFSRKFKYSDEKSGI